MNADRRTIRAGLRAEDGLTLIELLVTMTISIVLLIAVLNVGDLFASNSAATTRLTDAEDQMRIHMGTLIRDLRDAPPVATGAAAGSITPIWAARAGDMVFRSPHETTGWLRYCVGPTAGGVANGALRVGRLSGTYADPGPTCPAGTANGWTYGDLVPRNLRDPGSTIAYDSCPNVATTACDAAAVGTVTLTIAIEHNPGRILRLTSSVTPRNLG